MVKTLFCDNAADRRRVDRCTHVDRGRGRPLDGAGGLQRGFGIIRACAGDVWSLCSDVLPDVLRIKSCVQNKMGQLSKGCLDKLLDGFPFLLCCNGKFVSQFGESWSQT